MRKYVLFKVLSVLLSHKRRHQVQTENIHVLGINPHSRRKVHMRNHCNSGIHQHKISYVSILNADQYTPYCTTSNPVRRTYKCLTRRYAKDTAISVVLTISNFYGPKPTLSAQSCQRMKITLGTPRRLLFPTHPASSFGSPSTFVEDLNFFFVTPRLGHILLYINGVCVAVKNRSVPEEVRARGYSF